MSTRKQIIKAYHNRESLQQSLGTLRRRIDVLERKRDREEEIFSEALAVDEIYKGVPLSTRYGTIREVDSRHRRSADIYKNAQNKKTFGGNLRDDHTKRRKGFLNGSLWLGAYWRTKKELMEIAREWVAFGKIPRKVKR